MSVPDGVRETGVSRTAFPNGSFRERGIRRRCGVAFKRTQSGEDKEDRPMARDPEALRDWHRLFGLLLTDFFSGSPFAVEVERDLSRPTAAPRNPNKEAADALRPPISESVPDGRGNPAPTPALP